MCSEKARIAHSVRRQQNAPVDAAPTIGAVTDTAPALTVRVEALGRTVDIEVPDDASFARLREQWSRCLVSDPGARAAAATVYYPADSASDLAEYAVASQVTLRFIEGRAGELTMLHAAGVADPGTGEVTALIAASGIGKTTAARLLCAADFGYITDETVAVSADGSVLPYPKPLSVITDGTVHKQQHGPDELGLLAAPGDPRLTRIVLLERNGEDGDLPSIKPVALLDGILALIPQLSYLTRMPTPLLSLVRLAQACGGIHRLTYLDIEQCAGELRGLTAASPIEPADVEHLGSLPNGEELLPAEVAAQCGKISRGAFLDAVRIDDELLLLVADHPIRCSGLGATVWQATPTPRTEEELVAICVELHGAHPDAAHLVRTAIEQLCAHDVLRRN